MDYKSLPDSHLVVLLVGNDERAFREIYMRYWYALYQSAAVKTGRKDVAEEMAQEVFEVLWDKRDRLKIENLGAYLHRSLRNRVVDYIRRNILEENYLEGLRNYFPETYIGILDEIQVADLTHAVSVVLSHLPEKTQSVFRLSRFDHLSIPEIAARLNTSEKTVEYHLSKALTFLRRHLKEFIALILGVALAG